jgi:hypothetical protein
MTLFDALSDGGPIQYIVLNRSLHTIAVWDPSCQWLRILTDAGIELDAMPYHASLELMPTNDPEFWQMFSERIRRGDL